MSFEPGPEWREVDGAEYDNKRHTGSLMWWDGDSRAIRYWIYDPKEEA